jgi:hypothetical protein
MDAEALVARAVEALIATGRPGQAESILGSITSAYWRVWVLAGVAAALAATGHHEQAIAIARQAQTSAQLVTHPNDRADAEALAARALATAEQRAQTITTAGQAQTARLVPDSSGHAKALAAAAEQLAGTGNIEAASQLTAIACATGEWAIALRPALLLAPSAYVSVIGVLEARHTRVESGVH